MYPDKNEIEQMAEYVARWTYRHLIQTTDIERVPAAQIAAAARNRYAEALEVAIMAAQAPAEHPPGHPTMPDIQAVTAILDSAIDRHLTRREPNAPPIRRPKLVTPRRNNRVGQGEE